MKLEHLNLDQLKACPINVRKKGAKDVDDLTASIRAIGLIQPILDLSRFISASSSL